MGKISSEIAFISPHNAYFMMRLKKIMKENIQVQDGSSASSVSVSYNDHLFSMFETFALSVFDH